MKLAIGRFAQAIGPDFELFGISQIDVLVGGNKAALAAKCRQVANNAIFLRAGLRAGSLAATKLKKQVAEAAATRQLDTVLLETAMPVWQERANDARAAFDKLDAERDLHDPAIEDGAGNEPMEETFDGDTVVARPVSTVGALGLRENSLLLSYVARFASPQTTLTVYAGVLETAAEIVSEEDRRAAARELDNLATLGGCLADDIIALRNFLEEDTDCQPQVELSKPVARPDSRTARGPSRVRQETGSIHAGRSRLGRTAADVASSAKANKPSEHAEMSSF